jgi:flagellar protein FlbD
VRLRAREPGDRMRRWRPGKDLTAVITLSRLDGSGFVVNAELIQLIETVPDTHLILTDGKHLIVREAAEQVVARVIDYRRAAYGPRRAVQAVS